MEDDRHNKKLSQVFLLLALAATNTLVVVHGRGTHVGFYNKTCPYAESIIRATVKTYFRSEPSVAAGLLRMHFHDCFVRGCDASILISGPHTEQASSSNDDLNGVDVIEDAKKELEAACPGVVSCADILALAARDSVVLSGGESWQVPTGRRDGRVSKKSEPPHYLPGPDEPLAVLKRKFAKMGLNTQDLVTLSGAHTIGLAACSTFSSRLMGNGSDPSINPEFLPKLKKLCPQNDYSKSRVGLDYGSHLKFDTSYFENIRHGRGILRSDQALWTHNSTRPFARAYLATHVFNLAFAKSMVKMSKIGLKTGDHGEIRKKCYAVN